MTQEYVFAYTILDYSIFAHTAGPSYSSLMLHQIAHHVYRLIREHGELTYEEIGVGIKRKWQVPWRWEEKKEEKRQEHLPKRSHEAILVKMAKLTREAFGEIMCQVLTEFVGRQFTMGPPADYLPALPLARVGKLYSLHHNDLEPETRQIIDEMMCQARNVDTTAESTIRFLAREITRQIEQGLAAKGKSLSSSDGD